MELRWVYLRCERRGPASGRFTWSADDDWIRIFSLRWICRLDMRVLLYQNRRDHFSADLLIDPSTNSSDKSNSPEKFEPLIDAVRRYDQEMTGIVKWSADQAR